MHKHILIATDGYDIAQHAAEAGLDLAKVLGARVSAVTVTIPWSSIIAGEVATAIPPTDYDARVAENAAATLKKVEAAATARGLVCTGIHKSDALAWRAIVAAASEKGCDLIVVGSHGRSGVSRLLLGSETIKLLSHSKLPVYVHRE